MGYIPDRLQLPIAPRVETTDTSRMSVEKKADLASNYYEELTTAFNGLAGWIQDYPMQFAPAWRSGRNRPTPFQAQEQVGLPLALSKNTEPARMLFMTNTGLHMSRVVRLPGSPAVYPERFQDVDRQHTYEHSNGALLLKYGPPTARMLDVFRQHIIDLYRIRPTTPKDVKPEENIGRAPSLASIPQITRDARFFMAMNGYNRAVYPSDQLDFPYRAGMAARGWNTAEISSIFVELTGLGLRLGKIAVPEVTTSSNSAPEAS